MAARNFRLAGNYQPDNLGQLRLTCNTEKTMVPKNSIDVYLHCKKCLQELPRGQSPASYARYSVGWTRKGLQVWCTRHDRNILHVDFDGKQYVGDITMVGDFGVTIEKVVPLVREAMKNARENGHEFATSAEWADDMKKCDAYLEDYPVEVLKWAVDAVKAQDEARKDMN